MACVVVQSGAKIVDLECGTRSPQKHVVFDYGGLLNAEEGSSARWVFSRAAMGDTSDEGHTVDERRITVSSPDRTVCSQPPIWLRPRPWDSFVFGANNVHRHQNASNAMAP